MGSKSSVYSVTDSHDDNSNLQSEYAATRGDGNTVSVSMLDGDAISKALSFAGDAAKDNNSLVGDIVGAFKDWTKQVNSNATSALNAVTQSNNDSLNAVRNSVRENAGIIDSQKIIIVGFGVVVVVGGLYFLSNKK